jgi:hypothetical protein
LGTDSYKVFWHRLGVDKPYPIAWLQEGLKPSAELAVFYCKMACAIEDGLEQYYYHDKGLIPPKRTNAQPPDPLRLRELRDDGNRDFSLDEVTRVYNRVRGRQLGSAVFISDLATELEVSVPKLQEWIKTEVIKSGHGSLDEGHWPTATEGQRAAAIEHLGSRRLLIRFSEPDRMVLIKGY